MSIILLHTLLAAPLPHVVHTTPPPCRRSVCPYLVRYVQAHAQTVNNGGEQTTTTKPKNAPPMPTSKRRNKKTDEGKQCKNNELDRARKKTWGICKDSRVMQRLPLFCCWTNKDPCLIYFTLCFDHKAMVSVVTAILAMLHIALRCCGGVMWLVAKSRLLACMLTLVFNFVFMATC